MNIPRSINVSLIFFVTYSICRWCYSPSSKTGSFSYTGKLATYDGGGFYVDFPSTYEEAKELIESLKKNGWITRGTRCVFVDFTVYNANLNLFSFVKYGID